MKKKIIIGVGAFLSVVTIITIYILVILSPYRSIEALQNYLSKENVKYEATIEFSSNYDGAELETSSYSNSDIKTYTTLYNKVVTYKFNKDSVIAYHYADFETTDGEYLTNELCATFFYEETKTGGVKYSLKSTDEDEYFSSPVWSRDILWDGDITEQYLVSYTSLYRYIYKNTPNYVSGVYCTFKEVDGLYYQALNGAKIVDYPIVVELKTNKVIITRNEESGDSTVITLSNLKTTKVNSPIPKETNDGFIFDYNENKDSYNLVEYTGSSKNVVIPQTYNDGVNGEKGIGTLGVYCFYNNTYMENITLSGSITEVLDYAFYMCEELENVYYEGNIEQMCDTTYSTEYAHPMLYAENFYIKNSETNEYEELKEIVIPDTVTSIGNLAFYKCSNLENITIPVSVETIGFSAFTYCESVENVYYNGDLEDWFNMNISFSYQIGWQSYANNSQTTPLYYAENFYIKSSETNEYETVTSIVIPDSVTSISSYNFCGFSNLESITIPSGITYIGSDAFYNCINLENVYYDGTIEAWCSINFRHSGATPMYYAENFYLLDSETNEYEEIINLEIPDSVTTIEDYVFYGFNNIISIEIADSVESIGLYAFYKCESLESIKFENIDVDISSYAFSGCDNLTTIYVPVRITGAESILKYFPDEATIKYYY